MPSLHRNRELNNCGFLVENCAVSNKQDAIFYLHPIYIVGGTTERQSGRPVRVPARSLADLNARHGPFHTLIVDIEGAELEIFSAAPEVLRGVRLWLWKYIRGRSANRALDGAGITFSRRPAFQKLAGITEAGNETNCDNRFEPICRRHSGTLRLRPERTGRR